MLLFEFLLRLSAILKLDFLKSLGKSGSARPPARYEIRRYVSPKRVRLQPRQINQLNEYKLRLGNFCPLSVKYLKYCVYFLKRKNWRLVKVLQISVFSLRHYSRSMCPGGTPRNSCWAVPPGPQNPDALSDQKSVIFHNCFQTRPYPGHTRPGL